MTNTLFLCKSAAPAAHFSPKVHKQPRNDSGEQNGAKRSSTDRQRKITMAVTSNRRSTAAKGEVPPSPAWRCDVVHRNPWSARSCPAMP